MSTGNIKNCKSFEIKDFGYCIYMKISTPMTLSWLENTPTRNEHMYTFYVGPSPSFCWSPAAAAKFHSIWAGNLNFLKKKRQVFVLGNKGGETALAERMERIRRIGLILFDIILHGKNSKVCRNIVRVAGAGIFWVELEPFFCPATAPTLYSTVKYVIFTGT